MDIGIFNSVLAGLLIGGVIRVYSNNINKKRHIIDKNKVRRLTELNIKKVPLKNKRLKYTEDIECFYNIIKKELPYISLENFNTNIYDLVINEKELPEEIYGRYYTKYNLIELLENDISKSLTHEMLHMSSTIYDGKIEFSGFNQKSKDFEIGYGINEGYTSLLDKRYFKEVSNSYLVFQILASFIEQIIGQEKMTKMYFEADLYGLIQELSKYCDENLAYKLVYEIDFLFNDIETNDIDDSNKEKLKEHQKAAKKVSEILLVCYINYLKNSLNKGLLEKKKFNELLHDFIIKLSFSYKVGNHDIKYLTPELFSDVIDWYFPENENNVNYKISKVK